eukprot:TRINITY_DN11297_c0_g1_i1.p1 TRINITY_DN11297_c0_g1~~TRINITY_DN11297_c0_g1_i1.p1  ORF type:complete len:875 (+),score=258.65 TRINITY_DN11297_c0_g1_i1:58-2682(+)
MSTARVPACPVCFDEYSATGSQRPVVMPCGHGVCSECSRKVLAGGESRCPVCRATVHLPARGLPANYALLEALPQRPPQTSTQEKRALRALRVHELAERINVAFVVDCTGSMTRHIEAVKCQIEAVVRDLEQSHAALSIRLAFVGYRDYGTAERFTVLPFTSDVGLFRDFVAGVRTLANTDPPEDVLGGLDKATRLDWSTGDARTKVLIHICDDPCHGTRYHTCQRDRFPDGDPSGLKAIDILRALDTEGIQYTFGKITHRTDQMCRVFNEEMGRDYLQVQDVSDTAGLGRFVSASLHQSVQTTVTAMSEVGARPRQVQLDPSVPEWSGIAATPVKLRVPRDVAVADLQRGSAATQRFLEKRAAIRVAPHFFAQGESRFAAHAVREGPGGLQRCVAKEFKSVAADDQCADAYLALAEVSAVARCLAKAFCEKLPGAKIEFVSVDVAETCDGGDGCIRYNLEPLLPDSQRGFERYCNNLGHWDADLFDPRLAAFALWTSQVTGGHMMVVDLQGVRLRDGSYVLTDPVVLCEDYNRFGSGNLGPHAMSRCLRSLESRRIVDPAQARVVVPVRAAAVIPGGAEAAGMLIEQLHTAAGTVTGRTPPVKMDEAVIRSMLQQAREVIMSQPPFVEVQSPVNVCGDTHGQYADLLRIFTHGGSPGAKNYVFLGDYVDRGRKSLEVMTLLFAYKVKYPENIVLLRGNHEEASINRIYGFYDECKRRYNIKLWKVFADVFNCLPLSALIDESILCMHGGLSPELTNFDQIRAIRRPLSVPDAGLVCDLLWADPEITASGWCENDRGVSFTFGADIVQEACQQLSVDLVCRAHQVVEDGYEFFADRKLVTLFSAPNYVGEFDNCAAIMHVDEALTCSFTVLKPV